MSPRVSPLACFLAGGVFAAVPLLAWQARREERLRAEAAALATERATLERAQRDRIRALRQTETLKDQFLAIMSHELRTPINAVTGFGSILQDELLGPLNERQQEVLGKMLGSADGLLEMVNDLLDLTHIQAGRMVLSPRAVDLHEVARDLTAGLRTAAEARGITLELDLAPDLPAFTADEQRVAQALAKLLSNALKFTPAGGRVTVRAYAADDEVVVEVHDTGDGIAEEDVARLFQRFVQLDMSSTRRAGGTGLGLYLARCLVEAHGGRIGVRSLPGVGSTFWFTLPHGASPSSRRNRYNLSRSGMFSSPSSTEPEP